MKLSPVRLLILLTVLVAFLKAFFVPPPVFPDQFWFFNSAKTSLALGQFPLVGITSSIVWLHQGAVWTWLIIPVVALFGLNFSALSLFAVGLTITLPLFVYSVVNRLSSNKLGFIAALFTLISPYFVTQSVSPYHTTPLPHFFFLTLFLFQTRHWILVGLFMAFLYQLHLLTFVYWPLFLWLTWKQGSIRPLLLGFLLGLLPFFVYGPTQTVGIFIWAIKQVLTGPQVGSGISAAYISVLSGPLLLLFSVGISRLPRFRLPVALLFFVAGLLIR